MNWPLSETHISPACSVQKTLWKHFQGKIVHQKVFAKQTPNFFSAPSGRYQDIIHLLQNPKLLWNAIVLNNHNLSHKKP